MDEQINDGYEMLVEAIILQAISDYKIALKYKDREANSKYMKYKVLEAKRWYQEVRDFFHSDYYRGMCKIDGDAILEQIEKEVAEGNKKRRSRPYRKTV